MDNSFNNLESMLTAAASAFRKSITLPVYSIIAGWVIITSESTKPPNVTGRSSACAIAGNWQDSVECAVAVDSANSRSHYGSQKTS